MNLLDGELVGRTFTVPTGFTIDVDGMAATGPLILGVRPDDPCPWRPRGMKLPPHT
jgi:multiple sugar transport system ATP-binding protein